MPSLFRQRRRRRKLALRHTNPQEWRISKSTQAARTSRNARAIENGRPYVAAHRRADGSGKIK